MFLYQTIFISIFNNLKIQLVRNKRKKEDPRPTDKKTPMYGLWFTWTKLFDTVMLIIIKTQ